MTIKLVTDSIKQRTYVGRWIGGITRVFMEWDMRVKLRLFAEFIKGKRILDVGVGSGSLSYLLQMQGLSPRGLDVEDKVIFPGLYYHMYDGEHFPSKDKAFDTGFIICVLHHCSKQMRVLEEAMRTCKRLIILEDTYRSTWERMLVALRDRVGNFEFYGHNYRTSADWVRIFRKRKWAIIYQKDWSNISFYGMYGRQSLFVIEPD